MKVGIDHGEKVEKQKRKNIRWPAVVAGVAVILLAFVFP